MIYSLLVQHHCHQMNVPAYLDLSNPDSVMVCLLKSLEACPMTTRKLVISNIVFAGTVLFQCPHVPLLVVQQLKAVLAAARDQP